MGTDCPCVENDGSIEPKSLGQNGYGWSGDPIVLLTAPHAVYRNKQFTATLQSHYWARCEPPAILDKSGSEKTSEHVFQTLLITPKDSAPWKSASRSSAKLCLPIPFHNGSHVRRALITANASQAVHRKKQFTAINCDARYSLQKNITAPQTAAFHTSSSPHKAVYRHESTTRTLSNFG